MSMQKQEKTKEKEIMETIEDEHASSIACESFQADLDVCKKELADWQSKYTRLSADFENYKRRIAKEHSELMGVVRAQMLTNVLAIVDDFDRAMSHKDESETRSWVNGITMIYQSMQDYLKKMGVKEVSYDLFDPSLHEALLQVESDDHKPGEIVEVMEKGYMLGDRVVRPAKVSVAK